VLYAAGPVAAPLFLSLTEMKSMCSKLDWLISGGISLAALLLGGTTPAVAQSIADKVEVCARCHGTDGKPLDKATPVIWGQRLGYIYIQLRDFKRGDRKNEIVQHIASSFDKDDMLAIAEYFSNKPWPDLGQPRSPKDITEKALSANSSVGCTGCHLDQFQGSSTIPRLAGAATIPVCRT
jgi:cytochrome c553